MKPGFWKCKATTGIGNTQVTGAYIVFKEPN
jgi:hypothetical protein